LDLIVFERPGPAGEVLAVEHVHESLRRVELPKESVGFVAGDFADEKITPADLASVRLQLDRAFLQQRLLAVEEVLQAGVVDDELAVEINRGALAELDDAEGVPFAERLVGQDERVFAGRAGAVVPQSAATLVGAEFLFALVGVVPDLHLRRSSQVDAAV